MTVLSVREAIRDAVAAFGDDAQVVGDHDHAHAELVLWRTEGGDVVALQDRCAHRAYPLSAGALDGDTVRCGLCGFEYDTGGQCVAVPTQPRVPFGAHVASYPVQERDGVVWLWLGESGRARLHRVPELPWLTDERCCMRTSPT